MSKWSIVKYFYITRIASRSFRWKSFSSQMMDYTRFLNHNGRIVKPAFIRQILAVAPPDVDLSATGGFPNPVAFPFESSTFDLKDGTKIEIAGKDMRDALQYGKTSGHDKLHELLYKMQCDEHNPPTTSLETGPSKMRMLMSPGAQMALLTINMICSQKGVPVVFGTPSFAIISASLIDDTNDSLCVEEDSEGIDLTSLRNLLSKWKPEDVKTPESGIPRILWINPTCSNPGGVTTSALRRKEIYAIAQEYDLLIVEDDPYYYLQECKPRIPSFLSLDVDGRVVRIDTFSKIVSPGLRIAFVSGPDEIIKRMEWFYMQSCQHTCSLSQVLVYKLLTLWGQEGFKEHIQNVIRVNQEKRRHALAMADKWLKGLAEWSVPLGGMYVLLKVYNTGLTGTQLNTKLMEVHKVSLIPSEGFYPKDAQPNDLAILRVSIGMADGEVIEKVMKGLADVIQCALKPHP